MSSFTSDVNEYENRKEAAMLASPSSSTVKNVSGHRNPHLPNNAFAEVPSPDAKPPRAREPMPQLELTAAEQFELQLKQGKR